MLKASFLTSYADPALIPTEGLPQVAFLGRSNAGKSSLINSMTGVKDLARTSSTPGRTRLINVFDIEHRYHLIDLPGYGFTKMSKEKHEDVNVMLDEYLTTSKLLRCAVVILDSRLGPTESDRAMIASIAVPGIPTILIANKVDKLSKAELSKSLAAIRKEFPDAPVIAHSTQTGQGRGEISDAIRKFLT